jgi:hypothetical protein
MSHSIKINTSSLSSSEASAFWHFYYLASCDLQSVLAALDDGAALASYFSDENDDENTETVENVHAFVKDLLSK